MIGVVGSAGDLGTQLVDYIAVRGIPLATFDPWVPTSHYESVSAVVAAAPITHWCAPLVALEQLEYAGEPRQVILHSSVMNLSFDALLKNRRRIPDVRLNIVHCLMNGPRTVNVARGHVSRVVAEHLTESGFLVRPKTIAEHDRTAAMTQGAAMVLCELLLNEMQDIDPLDLTPSGEWLLKLLEERAMHWTDVTKQSVLRNPALKELFSPARIEEVFQRYLNI